MKPGIPKQYGAAVLFAVGLTTGAHGADLDDLAGCWITKEPSPVSRLTDAKDPASAATAQTMSLLLFNRIGSTQYLVFGSIFEWSEETQTISGPVFKNGAFDPLTGTVTFGSPGGGLARAHLGEDGKLIYAWTVSSSEVSIMSVREMERIPCNDAKQLSQALLERKRVRAE